MWCNTARGALRLFGSAYMLLPLRLNAGAASHRWNQQRWTHPSLRPENPPTGRRRRSLRHGGRDIAARRCPRASTPPCWPTSRGSPRFLMGRCRSGPGSTPRGPDPVPAWCVSAHVGASWHVVSSSESSAPPGPPPSAPVLPFPTRPIAPQHRPPPSRIRRLTGPCGPGLASREAAALGSTASRGLPSPRRTPLLRYCCGTVAALLRYCVAVLLRYCCGTVAVQARSWPRAVAARESASGVRTSRRCFPGWAQGARAGAGLTRLTGLP